MPSLACTKMSMIDLRIIMMSMMMPMMRMMLPMIKMMKIYDESVCLALLEKVCQ